MRGRFSRRFRYVSVFFAYQSLALYHRMYRTSVPCSWLRILLLHHDAHGKPLTRLKFLFSSTS